VERVMLARSPGTSLIFRCRGFSWSKGWILAPKGTTSIRAKKTAIKGPALVGIVVVIALLIVFSVAIAMLHKRRAWRRKREQKNDNQKNVEEKVSESEATQL
jgi:membrane protein implicated in regulation of membrane protease activity